MKTVHKTAKFTSERGGEFTLNVTYTRGYEKVKEHNYNDGWESDTERLKPIMTSERTLTVSDRTFKGDFSKTLPKGIPSGFYGSFIGTEAGAKKDTSLPLSKALYDNMLGLCELAKHEAEQDKDYQEYLKQEAEREATDAEYRKHKKNVDNMMTLGGGTY